MRMGKLLSFVGALVCVLGSSRLAHAVCNGSAQVWTCDGGSSVSDVQSAIDGATDGATITFAAGGYSWGDAIHLANDKGVTLICQGAGTCVVTVTTTGQIVYMDTLSGQNDRLYRVSGFKFKDAPDGSIPFWFYGVGTLSQLRIDHDEFENFGTDSLVLLLGETSSEGRFYGVLDSNYFHGPVNFQVVKILGHGDATLWGPSPKGSAENFYVEDNAIHFDAATNLGLGCVDIWNAASIVWRHNTVENCLVTAHGTTHGSGSINFELYGNTLKRTAGSGEWEDGTRLFHHQGSGEIIAFDNTFTSVGAHGNGPLAVTHYRSAPPDVAGYDTSLGRCDGTNSLDGNLPPTATYLGYPCWRQPGRDGLNHLSPMYSWNNAWSDGEKIDLEIENPWNATNPGVEDHIKAERDYYNGVSTEPQNSTIAPFDGSSGMGFGTLADRPTTCTTSTLEPGGGVGYFATDDGPHGTLYRCSTENSWTKQYTPFTYPHPLRGEGGAAGTGGGSGSGGTSNGGTGNASGSGGNGGGLGGSSATPSDSDDDGGCGCRVPSGRTPNGSLVFLAGLALISLRGATTSRRTRYRRNATPCLPSQLPTGRRESHRSHR